MCVEFGLRTLNVLTSQILPYSFHS